MRLRAWEPEDAGAAAALYDHPEVLSGLTSTWPQGIPGVKRWIEEGAGKDDALRLVVERLDEGVLLGAISLGEIEAPQRTGLLGLWVGEPFWDSGYGTDALRTLCRFAFDHMNMHRIELSVLATNARAIHAYEKVGFALEGTRRQAEFVGGEHVDAHIMGLLAGDLLEG